MAYNRIEVRPISGALGAEIHGVDLSKPLNNETFSEVHQALLDYLVIFFPDQHITQEHQKEFGRRFGPLNTHPFVHPLTRRASAGIAVAEGGGGLAASAAWRPSCGDA